MRGREGVCGREKRQGRENMPSPRKVRRGNVHQTHTHTHTHTPPTFSLTLPFYPPSQVTQLERHMNVLVACLFAWVFSISCILAGGQQIWLGRHPGEWYLQYEEKWPDLGMVREGGWRIDRWL